jgi:hypothetical protein
MKKAVKGVNPELEDAISQLLAEVMASTETSLTDKMKVIDRAINLEKLRLKVSEDEWGSGFMTPEDDEPEK